MEYLLADDELDDDRQAANKAHADGEHQHRGCSPAAPRTTASLREKLRHRRSSSTQAKVVAFSAP
ncbi:MAG: hypothetical protein U1E35_03170 [Rhodospirillales bacterium]